MTSRLAINFHCLKQKKKKEKVLRNRLFLILSAESKNWLRSINSEIGFVKPSQYLLSIELQNNQINLILIKAIIQYIWFLQQFFLLPHNILFQKPAFSGFHVGHIRQITNRLSSTVKLQVWLERHLWVVTFLADCFVIQSQVLGLSIVFRIVG